MADKAKVKRKKMKKTWDDWAFDIITNAFLVFFIIIVFYPLWFVLMASFSNPVYVNSGVALLFPRGFTLAGYKQVLEDARIWRGYGNTIIYVLGGTLIGTCMTILAGFSASRKDVFGNSVLIKLLMFTMYFGGGTIPTYIVIQKLGLLDTRFLMCILGSFSVYNMIVVRSFMANSIPEELYDAATIDGCGIGNFFFKIVLPLSKAIIAVIVLYIAVAHWNSYFNAMMYLLDASKESLQLYLRQVLIASQARAGVAASGEDAQLAEQLAEAAALIKYATIVVSTVPILCMYPFVQKYFVKGVMIGSVKG